MKMVMLLICAALLGGCINSSTVFAWRSSTYNPAIEAGQTVDDKHKDSGQTVQADKTFSDMLKDNLNEK